MTINNIQFIDLRIHSVLPTSTRTNLFSVFSIRWFRNKLTSSIRNKEQVLRNTQRTMSQLITGSPMMSLLSIKRISSYCQRRFWMKIHICHRYWIRREKIWRPRLWEVTASNRHIMLSGRARWTQDTWHPWLVWKSLHSRVLALLSMQLCKDRVLCLNLIYIALVSLQNWSTKDTNNP